MSFRLRLLEQESFLTSWRSPASFTALVPMVSVTEPELRGTLGGLAGDFERALRAVGDLHSFRLVVVPADAPGLSQLHLLFNTVHDRPLGDHLASLVDVAGALLARAFAGAGVVSADELPALWRRHRIRHNTLHLGAARRSLADIRLDQALRDEIGNFADGALAAGTWHADTPAETVRRDIRAHVAREAKKRDLPDGPAAPSSKLGRALQFVDLVTTFSFPAMGMLKTDIAAAVRRVPDRGVREVTRVAHALWWVYAAVPTALALLLVRLLERIEPDIVLPAADAAKVERLEEVEDRRLKNEVTYWFKIKETGIRRLLMKVVLWGSEGGCRHLWTDGALAGIDTIHYARLLQLARRRAMLFMSDYDGSLDRYLLDFTGVGSRAVIPISSSVAGCPTTRWLYGKADPTSFAPRLRNLLRTYQLETSVWYNAYPLLTVRDVRVNASIREGLFAGEMTEAEAQGWTDLL